MPLPLFQAFGVELEYMVVDRASLAVRPIVDALLRRAASLPGAHVESESIPGQPDEVNLPAAAAHGSNAKSKPNPPPNPLSLGGGVSITVGNELASHVLEFKVTDPAPSLTNLDADFHHAISQLNALLAADNAMLLPTGMHPTMDPWREMKVWPHGNAEVYSTFNRIFDCRGHGWANLQAAHLNLPFADASDPHGEFAPLHAAIRVLLPILPALTASSPIMDARVTGILDNRLEVYRANSRRIPEAAGKVIPEPAYTQHDYDREIFQKIYKAFEPHDPEGILRHEWCNSRGAIARFSRNTIEIRVLDVQECPKADVAIAAGITSVVRAICEGRLGNLATLRAWPVDPLHDILLAVIRDADQAVITNADYLAALGHRGPSCTARDLWRSFAERVWANDPSMTPHRPTLDAILSHGCLARRILHATGVNPTREAISKTYRSLSECLATNHLFVP